MNNSVNNIYEGIQRLIYRDKSYLDQAKDDEDDLAIREYNAKLHAFYEVLIVVCAEQFNESTQHFSHENKP